MLKPTMQTLLYMSLAALSATIIPVQASVNSRLGVALQNPLLASLISFAGGALALALAVFLTTPGIPHLAPLSQLPWYLFTGGLLGAVFVTAVLVLVPHIGTANVLASAIFGQLLAAVIIDHFGLFGMPQSDISPTKLAGIAVMMAGIFLIQRG